MYQVSKLYRLLFFVNRYRIELDFDIGIRYPALKELFDKRAVARHRYACFVILDSCARSCYRHCLALQGMF